MSSPTPVGIITTNANGLQDELLNVGGIGLGVGVAIFALSKGWHLLRRFVG
jgi:hypothetical protein